MDGRPSPSISGSGKRLSNPLPPPFVSRYAPYADALRNNAPSVGITVHRDCKGNWDAYYRHNTVNGYKDRHYILREFLELREALQVVDGEDDDATVDPTKRHRVELDSEGQTTPLSSTGPSKTSPPLETSAELVEVGCGVGNTILPLLRQHASLRGTAFDISAVAVNLLRAQAERDSLAHRLRTGVVDIAVERVPEQLLWPRTSAAAVATAGGDGLRLASLVFVLCSVPSDRMAFAVETVAHILEPGRGVLFWRDYAAGDMAQQRFDAGNRGVLAAGDVGEDNNNNNNNNPAMDEDGDGGATGVQGNTTFARTNGTLSHFFTRDEIHRLFDPHFDTVELKLVERTVVNRKDNTEMPRRWWQGRFRRRRSERD